VKKRSISVAAVLALSVVSAAFAQSIPAPASSVDSNARAKVAITPIDTSNLATVTQLNNVAATAGSAYNYGYAAYTNGGFNSPWARSFAGSTNWFVYIDGNGYVYQSFYGSYQGVGYTSGSSPIKLLTVDGSIYGTCNRTYYAGPTSFNYYGQPGSWGVTSTCEG
jgi:hypothetical protein